MFHTQLQVLSLAGEREGCKVEREGILQSKNWILRHRFAFDQAEIRKVKVLFLLCLL